MEQAERVEAAESAMPQPLSRVTPSGDIHITPRRIMARPDLASRIAVIIASWSVVEGHLGYSLARLLQTTPHVGTAMYGALKSTTSQMAVLEAAAIAVLADDLPNDLKLFQALLTVAKRSWRERSALAHGIWATCPQVPDGLLLLTQADILNYDAALMRHVANLTRNITEGEPVTVPLPEVDRSKVMVYRANDLEAIERRILAVTNHFSAFWREFRLPDGVGVPQRQQLLSVPEIQAALRPPKTPPESQLPTPPPDAPL